MNWGWLLLRASIALTILTTLFLSQRFWYRSIWRATANWRSVWLRVAIRLLYIALLVLIIGSVVDGFRMGRPPLLIPTDKLIQIFAGLWFTSALFAYLAVKVVRIFDRLWASMRSAAAITSITMNGGTSLRADAVKRWLSRSLGVASCMDIC